VLDEEDPEKQKRLEKLEQKREAKLKSPKIKQLKIKWNGCDSLLCEKINLFRAVGCNNKSPLNEHSIHVHLLFYVNCLLVEVVELLTLKAVGSE